MYTVVVRYDPNKGSLYSGNYKGYDEQHKFADDDIQRMYHYTSLVSAINRFKQFHRIRSKIKELMLITGD